jgi:acyl carrier protein
VSTPDVEAVRARLKRIFNEVFEDSGVEYSDSLSRETLQAWDSLGHIRLISATEEEFGVQFTIEEIEGLTSAAQLLEKLSQST